MKNKKHKNKQSGRFMKFCIAAIIIQAVVYTWVHLILSFKTGMEISPTTSCAFYAFCVGEGSACAYLKSMKTKHASKNNIETNCTDDLDYTECDFQNSNDNLGGM